MFGLMFPKVIDNAYRGQWLALVLFAPILLLKLMMGFNLAGFNPSVEPRQVLQDVDGVPLDTFSADAISHIVFSTNAWGLALFTITLVGVIAFIRYRAMLPLAIFLIAFEQIGRKALNVIDEGWRLDDMAAGNVINYGFSIALALAFVLSIVRRRNAPA